MSLLQRVFIFDLLKLIASFIDKYDVTIRFVCKQARDELRKIPFPWNCYVCLHAAWNGRLSVLQWLRAQNPPCPWDDRVCEYAATNGHLSVLQWALAQDPPCPWNDGVCRDASEHGHLQVLQWLRAQQPPCPWKKDVCLHHAGTADVRDWILSQQD